MSDTTQRLFIYADPPYPGQAGRYKHNPRAAEVDPVALMLQMHQREPAGWALSTHSPALRLIVPHMPERTRIGVWTKPYAVFKPNVRPAYCWEPVVFWVKDTPARTALIPRDWVCCMPDMTTNIGAKPHAFCEWLFSILGVEQGDTVEDLFPGNGGVGASLSFWQATERIP